MLEVRRAFSPQTSRWPVNSRSTPNRSRVYAYSSFNSRLGVNGPAETDRQKVGEFPRSGLPSVVEDISLKLSNLSTNSSPGAPSKKSFNDRLSTARSSSSSEDGNLTDLRNDETDSVTSSETAPPTPEAKESFDDIINQFIVKEGSETMAKRDHTGKLKNLGDGTTKGREETFDFVLRGESTVEEEDTRSGSPPRSREQDRKYLHHSDIYLPKKTESFREESAAEVVNIRSGSPPRSREQDRKHRSDNCRPRSESPQCSAEKYSRHDFPLSFGSGSKKRSFYDCDVVEEVEKYFNKRFRLSWTNEWKLPEACEVFSSPPWKVKELLECKDRLNAVKEKLNDLKLKEWHAHTKMRNKAGQILWRLRKTVNPEFPTQAWCKFYENVSAFELIPEKAQRDRVLNSVHLCEAPGAFITSLNHYLKTNFDDNFEWNWLGTTLNPHYEGNPLSLMINEDRFILHTLDHWTFGEDQTGNLMTLPNLADLQEKAEKLGQVLLVTADGSIDCQDDPGEQENYVAWLHYCEALSAMKVLAKGGNFLLKMFTMFEHMTVCLLYLLSCAFEEVIVNKPATSKEGNSETYVVCKNYAGRAKIEPLMDVLSQNYGPNHPLKALFPREAIPQTFLDDVLECAQTFCKYQCDIIEANLKSYKQPSREESYRIETVRRAVADEFFRRYRIKELQDRDDIVGRRLINKMETYNMDPRLEVGSFSDRLRRAEVPDRQKILDLKADVELLDRKVLDQWPADNDIWWHSFNCEPDYNLSDDMQIAVGKPVKQIHSSKFCLGRLLDVRNKVREIIKESKEISLPSLNSWSEQIVDVPKGTIVLDFKNALWASSDEGLNAEQEYKAFKMIIEVFDGLPRDGNLMIYGYPLLTQFNVGLVYLLAHSFERMAVTRPKGQNFAVIFEKHDISCRKFKVKRELDEIYEEIQSGAAHGRTVLAMLPIQKLCTGDFYKYITMANNICVKEQVLELIEEYLKAKESEQDREKRRRTIA